jgi:hypothetical protein
MHPSELTKFSRAEQSRSRSEAAQQQHSTISTLYIQNIINLYITFFAHIWSSYVLSGVIEWMQTMKPLRSFVRVEHLSAFTFPLDNHENPRTRANNVSRP